MPPFLGKGNISHISSWYRGLGAWSWLRAHPLPISREFYQCHRNVHIGWEVVGHYPHLPHCWGGDDSDSPWFPSNDQPL